MITLILAERVAGFQEIENPGAVLVEGVSIRATERLTGIHRDTVLRLGVRVGNGCAHDHNHLMRGLNTARIEMDEAWSYGIQELQNEIIVYLWLAALKDGFF